MYCTFGKASRVVNAACHCRADTGTALVDYLQQERPTSAHRKVFLSLATPHQPLAASPAVSRIVQRVLRKAGVDAPRLGAHHLRHYAGFRTIPGELACGPQALG
ncbi:MAG: hypothetical protein ACR2NN_28775 [Bryobacteraceae bacterium]